MRRKMAQTHHRHPMTPDEVLYWLGGVFIPQTPKEFIVLAVNARDELLERLKVMASSFHHAGYHGGYFKDCDSQVCEENRQAIAKAEGK